MDLFSEHYARHEREALQLDIDRATQLGTLVAATKRRPRQRIARTASWLRATIHPRRRATGPARPVPTVTST
jgi:hypothetical protein